MKEAILIIVHPGSACGSANFNIGRTEANLAREALVMDMKSHEGPVVVVDGELSDELKHYPNLDKALREVIEVQENTGFLCSRIVADDNTEGDWPEDVAQHVASRFKPQKVNITGAWYYPDDSGGCVNAVYDALNAKGYLCEILESAVSP